MFENAIIYILRCYKLFGVSSECIVEKLAKDARFGLLVGHTLTPGSIAGVLVVLREALKCRHEAGASTAGALVCRWGWVLLGIVHFG